MYELILTSNARRDLRRLDATIHARVLNKLADLRANCDTHKHKVLTGPHKGEFSYRVTRDYRVLYTFDRQTRVLNQSVNCFSDSAPEQGLLGINKVLFPEPFQ